MISESLGLTHVCKATQRLTQTTYILIKGRFSSVKSVMHLDHISTQKKDFYKQNNVLKAHSDNVHFYSSIVFFPTVHIPSK